MSKEQSLMKQFNLPDYIRGKSFAEASKAINSKFEDRNDKASLKTKNELLQRLADAQEYLKMQQQPNNPQEHMMQRQQAGVQQQQMMGQQQFDEKLAQNEELAELRADTSLTKTQMGIDAKIENDMFKQRDVRILKGPKR